MSQDRHLPYKLIGAYDSETCNLVDGIERHAYPILHQLGVLDCPIEQVTADDVESHAKVELYRHAIDLYQRLDDLASHALAYVPVIACHNLGFDMYGLAPWLQSREQAGYEVKVLAKSVRKPITFTLCKDGRPRLVLWDTLVFSQKPLGYMGDECGYPKLSGDWDYGLTRTPDTPLTPKEVAYAEHDIYTLLAWLGYWCRLNPDIDPSWLGLRVVTKTGVVRQRRLLRYGSLKGKGSRRSVKRFWHGINEGNRFTDDRELFSCMASTRGGLTFCSSRHASVPYGFDEDSGRSVYGFDATSQHPAQMVSHMFPDSFHRASARMMLSAFKVVSSVTLDGVLSHWAKPFPVAFYGRFTFRRLRPKSGSLFDAEGIHPLASARLTAYKPLPDSDNQDNDDFKASMDGQGYKDQALGDVRCAFGKLISADSASLWLTELSAWEVFQAYEWDDVAADDGYLTMRFVRPSDLMTLSVMGFYGAKNAFKQARAEFYAGRPLSDADGLRACGIPGFVIDGMADGSIDPQVVESTYLGLKADLNALFGIEACNEYRRDTALGATGIEYSGDIGIVNAPKVSKAWYQCGQRIVGWSRVAQVCVMELAYPFCEGIINGDTDSVKFIITDDKVDALEFALSRHAKAVDDARAFVCSRVKAMFPAQYVELTGIGHYVREFQVNWFCSSWNKAYAIGDKQGITFTLAGVPTSRGVSQAARRSIGRIGFAATCDRFLGYNVTYPATLTGLNARAFPSWGDVYSARVTDYQGHVSYVCEPAALCLYPMAKTLNDTRVRGNADNLRYALRNRPEVCHRPSVVMGDGSVIRVEELM